MNALLFSLVVLLPLTEEAKEKTEREPSLLDIPRISSGRGPDNCFKYFDKKFGKPHSVRNYIERYCEFDQYTEHRTYKVDKTIGGLYIREIKVRAVDNSNMVTGGRLKEGEGKPDHVNHISIIAWFSPSMDLDAVPLATVRLVGQDKILPHNPIRPAKYSINMFVSRGRASLKLMGDTMSISRPLVAQNPPKEEWLPLRVMFAIR